MTDVCDIIPARPLKTLQISYIFKQAYDSGAFPRLIGYGNDGDPERALIW